MDTKGLTQRFLTILALAVMPLISGCFCSAGDTTTRPESVFVDSSSVTIAPRPIIETGLPVVGKQLYYDPTIDRWSDYPTKNAQQPSGRGYVARADNSKTAKHLTVIVHTDSSSGEPSSVDVEAEGRDTSVNSHKISVTELKDEDSWFTKNVVKPFGLVALWVIVILVLASVIGGIAKAVSPTSAISGIVDSVIGMVKKIFGK